MRDAREMRIPLHNSHCGPKKPASRPLSMAPTTKVDTKTTEVAVLALSVYGRQDVHGVTSQVKVMAKWVTMIEPSAERSEKTAGRASGLLIDATKIESC
jgi:hypothetical protein